MYYAIKRADPQARIIPAGVANADWKWLSEWREEYRKAYGRYPPVDGWNIHNYILDSCGVALNATEFKRRIIAFREWMKQIGDGAGPLFLTEYGVLYGNGCCGCPPIPTGDVVAYMQSTTRWLELTHAATAWAWFAVDTSNRFNGDLFAEGQILPTGLAYQQLVNDWQTRLK
jgi:hypothetical protein